MKIVWDEFTCWLYFFVWYGACYRYGGIVRREYIILYFWLMTLDKKGCTRLVFVFNKFVIKIPNFTVQHNHFLKGCVANWEERKTWKAFKGSECEFKNKIAPTLFCSWFGLIQIQVRCKILDRYLTKVELKYFEEVTTDIKGQNFGYYKNRIVCVDFA